MNGQQQYLNNYNRMISKIINECDGEQKELLKGYLNHLRDAFSISTKYAYLATIKRFLIYINKIAKEITYEDYTSFLNEIEDKSSTYKIATYSALKLFSEYLLASRRNLENSMQYVKISKTNKVKEIEKKEKRLKNVLHEDEIKHYLKNIESGVGSHRAKARQELWKERDRCMIELFLTTGMRCSAMYRLNVKDINLKEKYLVTIEKRDKKRVFYFSDNVRINIEEWLIRRSEILDGEEEDALFISNRKRRLDTSCIVDITHKYGLDIKNITPHKLRATFGTQLLEKTNGDLDKVRIAMGHESINTTELYMRRDETKIGKEIAELMEFIA